MTLIIEPYRYVSPLVNDKLEKGASIVELLTDYRTPCYVFKKNSDPCVQDVIATNVGVTLSNGNLTSFIFREESPKEKEIYTLEYFSEVKTILRIPGTPIPTNPEKQVFKSYFSRITVNGDYKDILSEFENKGWKIVRTEANPEGWKKNLIVLRDWRDAHQKNYNKIEQEALKFYGILS